MVSDHALPSRRYDLDALRAFAMLLGIVLHAALSFVKFPWVVQDRFQHPAYGLLVEAIHGFRMPLFFLLSGFFTAMLWRRRGLGGLIRQRARHIVLPLALGCVTIVPLMWGIVVWMNSGTVTFGAETAKQDAWSAARRGDMDMLAELVEAGVSLEDEDPAFGQTLLAWAIIGSREDAAAYLLESGADPNAHYRHNNTALHTAAFFGEAACAELLLEAGANVNARNDNGESPMDVMRHGPKVTEWIAGLLSVPIDFDAVTEGRTQIADLLKQHGTTASAAIGKPAEHDNGALTGLIMLLMIFPFFHHLWFLWFLCFMVVGFALAVGVVRLLHIPTIPAWLVRSPICWLWIVPLTMVPQSSMHMAGVLPGFGPDTSAGLLPIPHVLLYYGVFFGFGALYYESNDDQGHLGRAWWAQIPFALVAVLPLGLGLSLHLPWAAEIATDETRHVLAMFLEVLYTWLMTFGLIGLCRRVLSSEQPRIRYISDASYWLYLMHLPLIIAGQALLADRAIPSLAKCALLIVGTTTVLLVIYQRGVRYSWIGRFLNGPRERPARQLPIDGA